MYVRTKSGIWWVGLPNTFAQSPIQIQFGLINFNPSLAQLMRIVIQAQSIFELGRAEPTQVASLGKMASVMNYLSIGE